MGVTRIYVPTYSAGDNELPEWPLRGPCVDAECKGGASKVFVWALLSTSRQGVYIHS